MDRLAVEHADRTVERLSEGATVDELRAALIGVWNAAIAAAEPLGNREIADRGNRSIETVNRWVSGALGRPRFPRARGHVSGMAYRYAAEVDEWLAISRPTGAAHPLHGSHSKT